MSETEHFNMEESIASSSKSLFDAEIDEDGASTASIQVQYRNLKRKKEALTECEISPATVEVMPVNAKLKAVCVQEKPVTLEKKIVVKEELPVFGRKIPSIEELKQTVQNKSAAAITSVPMDVQRVLAVIETLAAPDHKQFLLHNYKSKTIKCVLEETNNGNNVLVGAVKLGDLEIIEQILQAGADVNKPQLSGETPIVESNNGTVAQFLIHYGADVNHVTNTTNETPLMHVLKKLSSSRFIFDPESDYSEEYSCTEEVIRVLLENGASVHSKNNYGRTPLMLAARIEDHENTLQMLLHNGANCGDQDDDGDTAIFHAINERCLKNAKFLVKMMRNNTDLLNLQNKKGQTALMRDVSRRPCLVMSELIDSGACVNITDEYGYTALHHAAQSFISKSHLRILIKAGCDLNQQTNRGMSPLMLAVYSKNYRAVSTLVDLGADVNAVFGRYSSATALSLIYFTNCFSRKTISCLEALLDKGADASYLRKRPLMTIIVHYPQKHIPRLIQCGLAPFDIDIDLGYINIPSTVDQFEMLRSASPLCLALLIGNVSLARYFWRNIFLTTSDLSSLPSNRSVKSYLQRQNYEECLSFLDENFSQPMSLFKMCFVAVTSAIGASPARQARINKLPLPRVLKDMLLFKSDISSYENPEICDLPPYLIHNDNVFCNFLPFHYPDSEEENSAYEDD